MENFVTNAIIVQWKGKDKILHSKTELIRFYLECAGLQDAQLCFNSLSYPFLHRRFFRQMGKRISCSGTNLWEMRFREICRLF